MSNADIAVLPVTPDHSQAATQLATALNLPLLAPGLPKSQDANQWSQLLVLDDSGLALQPLGKGAAGATRVDFVGGAVGHRRRFGGGKGQDIAKAVGLGAVSQLQVLDATAGLGRDAFVLASLGCKLTLLERSPIVAALLADGLKRAVEDPEVGAIISRMELVQGSAHRYLAALPADSVDVVYLDPMFPHRDKSAAVKKEMKALQSVLGHDLDADELLSLALAAARYRVVVKRPRKAPDLAGQSPSYRLEGKAGRFDIYALKKMSK